MDTYLEWAAAQKKIKIKPRLLTFKADNKDGMPESTPYCCYYCGCRGEKCTKDHFIPKSKRGIILVYACSPCQVSKRDFLPSHWVLWLKKRDSQFNETYVKRIEESVDKLWWFIEKNNIEYKKD